MKSIVCVFVGIIACVLAQNATSACDQNGGWNSTEYKELVDTVLHVPSESKRFDVLVEIIRSQSRGFYAYEVEGLLNLFQRETNKIDFLVSLADYILGMQCVDVYNILMTFQYETSRLEVLPYLCNLTTDLSNNATILKAFVWQSCQMDNALKIINEAIPLQCVWGDITAQNALFIIDSSSSMGTEFIGEDGAYYTRLQFISEQLVSVLRSLRSTQNFDILSFNDATTECFNYLVSANAYDIETAINYTLSLTPNGGTDMLSAVQAAVAINGLDAIYLLSDGQPNSDQSLIISTAQKWSMQNNNATFNTICFQEGGTYSPEADAFMLQLASAGNGVFRSLSGDNNQQIVDKNEILKHFNAEKVFLS